MRPADPNPGAGRDQQLVSPATAGLTLPRDRSALAHLVAEFWRQLEPLAGLPEPTAKQLMPTQTCWPELEPYGVDRVWQAIRSRVASGEPNQQRPGELDLLAPEWEALTSGTAINLPDFTTHHEPVPVSAHPWLQKVVLVSRLREVVALYGFTRIDAPEWEVQDIPDSRRAPLSGTESTWVPCAEMRGEGVFLRFDETRVTQWERSAAVRERARNLLLPAHRAWCERRRVDPSQWPGLRYVLHTFAHALIRELALDSGYSAAGIGERIYARKVASVHIKFGSGHDQTGGRREHSDERLAEQSLVLVRIQTHTHHFDPGKGQTVCDRPAASGLPTAISLHVAVREGHPSATSIHVAVQGGLPTATSIHVAMRRRSVCRGW